MNFWEFAASENGLVLILALGMLLAVVVLATVATLGRRNRNGNWE